MGQRMLNKLNRPPPPILDCPGIFPPEDVSLMNTFKRMDWLRSQTVEIFGTYHSQRCTKTFDQSDNGCRIRCKNCAELADKLTKRKSELLAQYYTSVVPSLGEQLQMDRERRRKKCGGVFNIGDKESLQALMKLKELGKVVLDVEKSEEDGHYYHRNCKGDF